MAHYDWPGQQRCPPKNSYSELNHCQAGCVVLAHINDRSTVAKLQMLQIATGKLFRGPVYRTNHLRGVLFSNLDRLPKDGILTSAGRLRSTDALMQRSTSFIYEIDEAIEGGELSPGMIVGYGADRCQQDFSALVSFYLQVTCSPDHSLVSRLTSGVAGLAIGVPPNHLVKRVFSPRVGPKAEEWGEFARWVDELLGLKRATYLVVMQAIRTLVTGLHRTADDLEVAYTLMVAALEAMAMKFDGHQTSWEDVEERRRSSIDAALSTADTETATAVRAAIAEQEHVLLRRRFKAFVLASVPDSFFGDDAISSVAPPGRLDLGEALDVAYEIRSKYVHALERLPWELTGPRGFAEMVMLLDRRTAMTFQGLFRVARAAIIEFVRRQPKIEKEPYNYLYETGSVHQVQLDPSAWMGPHAIMLEAGRDWFEGFLELFDRRVLGAKQPSMIGLRPSLDRLSELPQKGRVSIESKRGYVALLRAIHVFLPEHFQPTTPPSFLKRWGTVLNKPCPEALVLYCLSRDVPPWTVEQHEATLLDHLFRRAKKSGMRLPRRLDAAMLMELAERYRTNDDWPKAAAYLAMACDNFPELAALRVFQRDAKPDEEISWRAVLAPHVEVEDDEWSVGSLNHA